jgi:predicted AlkP superfamily pyrophosphatase or phosphodiesterase
VPAQTRARDAGNISPPRLLFVIVVDQFRYDFLERFRESFGSRGFRRLLNQGAFFTNAHYDYVPTFTACGHAAIFTGSIPAYNGIVGNAWFDRETGRTRIMVSDDSAHVVRTAGLAREGPPPKEPPGVSPRNLIGTTLGDQMRLATNLESKVVAVSFKDRSAILPGGQRPTGAFWFDTETGSFVTSDYYSKELPRWVDDYNRSVRPDKYFGARWELPSNRKGRAAPRSSGGKGFPYIVDGGAEKPGPEFYTAFQDTPFASEYLAQFAIAALSGESLGADRTTDLLSVSFSGPDLIGHANGPDSPEVADTYARLDRVIAQLLDQIDRRVGLQNTVVVLTGDHGVAPVPEELQATGFSAARISSRDLIAAANRALTARFGDAKWVNALVNDQLYLDRNLIAQRQIDPSEAERVAGDGALSVAGIVDYFTRSQILEGRMPGGPISRRVSHGFNRLRSGDVWLITRPFTFVAEGSLRTTHGTAYSYDTHVPIIFCGSGFRPGRYTTECSPSDIAPTLAALLRIEGPTNAVGRVLPVMAERAGSRSRKSAAPPEH